MDYSTIRKAATKIVDNIKAINGSISALQNKQDIISTSDKSMANSHEGKLKIEEIGGKCERVSYSGKNVLDTTIATTTTSGITCSDNGNGTFTLNGTASEDVTFVLNDFSVDLKTYLIKIFKLGGNYSGNVTFTTLDAKWGNQKYAYIDGSYGTLDLYNTYIHWRILIPSGTVCTNLVVGLMVAEDVTNWEPYTGGQPSPNPNYPQEIKKTVVSGIKTRGAQLCKSTTKHSDNIWGIALYVDCDLKPNTTYTFSFKGISGNTYYASEDIFTKGEWITLIDDVYSVVLTTKNELPEYRYISGRGWDFLKNGVTQSTPSEFEQVMLVEGTTALPYEPYTESTITLSEPIELYGIGDVKDTIDVEKGVVRRLYKFIGNSVSDFNTEASICHIYMPNDIAVHTGWNYVYKNILSNLFNKIVSRNNLSSNLDWASIALTTADDGKCYISFRITSIEQTEESYNTFLANTPIEVVFERAEEAIEPLPLVDQAALSSLSTYDNITYVEFDSEIEPTFKAKYGVTEIGGRILENAMTGLSSELLAQSDAERITVLESAIVNNIQD